MGLGLRRQAHGATQSVVDCLECGRTLPGIKTLYRYVEATGTKPEIRLGHG